MQYSTLPGISVFLMILPFNKFQNNLAEEPNEFNLIAPIITRLQTQYSLVPVLGAEIEFYLSKNIDALELSEIVDLKIKKEKGHAQFEIDIAPTSNIEYFIQNIRQTKTMLSSKANLAGYNVDFSPKPKINDYGSAMHFHLNFIGEIKVEELANILCNYTKQTIKYFLPKDQSFVRLDSDFMAPTHICWGGNNRTCLIRIPDTKPKRIEHRLCSADINPIYPIYAIVASIVAGLEDRNLNIFNKIYGNAFDSQYDLEEIVPPIKL